MATMGYSSLRQQAIDNRDLYEGNEEDQLLNQTIPMNPSLSPSGAGLINALRMRHGQERAASNFNPQWDAWYQAVSNATGGNPVIGGLRKAGRLR